MYNLFVTSSLFSKIGGKYYEKNHSKRGFRPTQARIFSKMWGFTGFTKTCKIWTGTKNFLSLSSVQKCQFYGYEQNEIENFKVPDDSLDLSVNEATDMLVSGETIYARVIGENEQSFNNLNSFVAFLRKCNINGDNFLLYSRD